MDSVHRVARFIDPSGAPQIAAFPETPPTGDSDLEVRIKHFTEIENFGFLGYVLAHELGEEVLGDELLDVTINWEHFVASTNALMVPGNPLVISDAVFQAKIDALDERSEALVRQVNEIARRRKHPKDD